MTKRLVTPDRLCEYCQGPIPPTGPHNVASRRFCSQKHRWLAWEERRFVKYLREKRAHDLRVAEESATYDAQKEEVSA